MDIFIIITFNYLAHLAEGYTTNAIPHYHCHILTSPAWSHHSPPNQYKKQRREKNEKHYGILPIQK